MGFSPAHPGVQAAVRNGLVTPAAVGTAAAPKPTAFPAVALTVTLPVPLLGAGGNSREHWRARHARVAGERRDVRACLVALVGGHPPAAFRTGRLAVTLTLLGRRRMDSDNAEMVVKAARDELASWLAIDDADPRAAWAVGQEPGGAFGVRVTIQRVEA